MNLFADDPVIGQWKMFTLVTGLDFPAGGIWRVYRGRADRENQIKELKFDFVSTPERFCTGAPEEFCTT